MRITNPSFPSTETNTPWGAVPTVLTAVVTGKNYYVTQISVANTTGAALTFTAQTATGVVVVPGAQLDANSTSILHYPEGTIFTNGLSWQANGAGVNAEIRGFTGAW